jgi:hypothetical protein
MKVGIDAERRAELCEWARANGLDPDKIDEHIEIVRGNMLRYREVTSEVDGTPVWETRVAPLRVPFPPGSGD